MTTQQKAEIKAQAAFYEDPEAIEELEHAEFLQDQIAEEEGHNASVADQIYE